MKEREREKKKGRKHSSKFGKLQHLVLKNHSDKIIASGNSFFEGSLFEFFIPVLRRGQECKSLERPHLSKGFGRGVNICTRTKKYQICKFLQICCSLPYFPSHQEQEMSSSSKIKKKCQKLFSTTKL